jgi:hypothetical protein
LHSSYDGLTGLLEAMRRHLQGGDKLDSEYMHEVFQRLILQFLDANHTEVFMDLEKADEPCIKEMTSMGWMSTATSNNDHMVQLLTATCQI